jgi:ankyrin repeat protein
MVRYILESGVSPNDANKLGETPLFLTIHKAKNRPNDDVLTVLKLLLKHGANPNQEYSDKNPIVEAIKTFNIRATVILLQNGASLNELPKGPTALHVLYKYFYTSRYSIHDNYGNYTDLEFFKKYR